MIKLFSLSLLLVIAGIIHLMVPQLFLPAMPKFIPYPEFWIYFTGGLEILLAFGPWLKRFKNLCLELIGAYFLLLLPIHIYVSWNHIPMFGITSPFWLWTRTLFQLVLVWWCWSLLDTPWVIRQKWKDVLFIHFKTDPKQLAPLVPFPLDLHQGEAVVSIVPFRMEAIRFPFVPALPVLSSLWELNLRTYVKVNGVPGVYFFTLETDSKLSEIIARNFFHLPYCKALINTQVSSEQYQFQHRRGKLTFDLAAHMESQKLEGEFDRWSTERYSLFTPGKKAHYQGQVMHSPWELQSICLEKINDHFSCLLPGIKLRWVSSAYCRELKVAFRPFKKIILS